MGQWQAIAERITESTGRPFRIERQRAVGGGDINAAYQLDGDGERYFVKLNAAARADMFAAEAAGLGELAASRALRVPEPICWGTAGDRAFLVLEHVELGGGSARAAEALGRGLATLHRTTRERFGWHRDNTIGSTAQPNGELACWVDFWRERRLGFQLELAARNGFRGALQERGARLMEALPALFSDYRPVPSLLHGDLWGGNWSCDGQGAPVIYDPAVYYGDREADIAMTELFGGFGQAFYHAYDEAWPRDAGYPVRKTLYNLYHILNHANLFGGGYAHSAEGMIGRLLAELG